MHNPLHTITYFLARLPYPVGILPNRLRWGTKCVQCASPLFSIELPFPAFQAPRNFLEFPQLHLITVCAADNRSASETLTSQDSGKPNPQAFRQYNHRETASFRIRASLLRCWLPDYDHNSDGLHPLQQALAMELWTGRRKPRAANWPRRLFGDRRGWFLERVRRLQAQAEKQSTPPPLGVGMTAIKYR
jgi:hypothetical protein